MKEKNKENAALDFYEMIIESWTWARLTDSEQSRFRRMLSDFDCYGRIKGSYDSRFEQCHMIYQSFLEALSYSPFGWREPKTEENPQF